MLTDTSSDLIPTRCENTDAFEKVRDGEASLKPHDEQHNDEQHNGSIAEAEDGAQRATPQNAFELYQPVAGSPGHVNDGLPCREAAAPRMRVALQIPEGQTVRAVVDHASGRLVPAADDAQQAMSFCSVPRKLSHQLAMFDHPGGALVDGLPALRLALLGAKSMLVLPDGCVTYVTERIVPYVGPPSDQMIKARQKCAYCKLPFDESTRVVSHRCGAVYHDETAETHPDVTEKDRLGCLQQIGHCLCCRRPISLEPYLVWDPSTAEGPA